VLRGGGSLRAVLWHGDIPAVMYSLLIASSCCLSSWLRARSASSCEAALVRSLFTAVGVGGVAEGGGDRGLVGVSRELLVLNGC
jgi:hypothetical protein